MKKFISISLLYNFCFLPLFSQITNVFPSSGSVGIGTISPAIEELEIYDASDAAGIIVQRQGGVYGKLLAGTLGAGFLFSQNGLFAIGPSSNISSSSAVESAIFTVYGNLHPVYPGQTVLGSWTPGDNSKLSVNGRIRSEEVKVVADITAPDYVFKEDYNLRSLEEVKSFIKEHGHLPEIPSAKEFKENGILIGQMSFDLLKKIEELTLYILELKEENSKLLHRIELLEGK
jgi:hypothetical protein